MRYFYLFTLTILCLTACQSKKKDAFLELTPVDTVIPEAKFPPLESGEVFLKEEDPFHGIIDLKGENVVADTFIFKPKESRMFISGDRMIMKNFSTSGDFGVNLSKNRMVYAYIYFKVLKYMDLEANTVRTLNFQQTGFDDGTLGIVDGLDQNVTHYWGMCAQEDYVYCLYSGRTPMEVGRESSKGNILV